MTASPSAATSAIPSILWVTADGQPEPGRGTVPGTTIADLGKSPDQYNPFGMAFAPDGTLYFIDIHIACKGLLTGLRAGQLRRPGHEGDLHQRPALDAGGRRDRVRLPDQRDGVRPGHRRCARIRPGTIVAPLSGPSENPAPDQGPPPTPRPRPASADVAAAAVASPGRSRRRPVPSTARRRPALGGAGGLAVVVRVAGLRHRAVRRPRAAVVGAPAAAVGPDPGPWDWPTYGHDAQHTFHGRTTLTEATVKTLRKAWFFPTGDAVTATPTVVDGTVYVGSWDDYFYALDLETGALRWKVPAQAAERGHAVSGREAPRRSPPTGASSPPRPGSSPPPASRPALVIFGGGYTLYALERRHRGAVLAARLHGPARAPPIPNADGTRIFSSPVVGGRHRALRRRRGRRRRLPGIHRGAPTSTPATRCGSSRPTSTPPGHVLNDGCGSVWSSGTVLPDLGLVVFGTADCDFTNTAAAVPSRSSPCTSATARWPGCTARHRPDLDCDWDFGATANAGVDAAGHATFLGEGARTAPTTRSTRPPVTLRWTTNVVFGGFSGGFIATTAYDGRRVSTAPPPSATSGASRQRHAGPLRPVQSPRHADAGADRPRLRRRAPGPWSGRRPGRLVRAHHRGRRA